MSGPSSNHFFLSLSLTPSLRPTPRSEHFRILLLFPVNIFGPWHIAWKSGYSCFAMWKQTLPWNFTNAQNFLNENHHKRNGDIVYSTFGEEIIPHLHTAIRLRPWSVPPWSIAQTVQYKWQGCSEGWNVPPAKMREVTGCSSLWLPSKGCLWVAHSLEKTWISRAACTRETRPPPTFSYRNHMGPFTAALYFACTWEFFTGPLHHSSGSIHGWSSITEAGVEERICP